MVVEEEPQAVVGLLPAPAKVRAHVDPALALGLEIGVAQRASHELRELGLRPGCRLLHCHCGSFPCCLQLPRRMVLLQVDLMSSECLAIGRGAKTRAGKRCSAAEVRPCWAVLPRNSRIVQQRERLKKVLA